MVNRKKEVAILIPCYNEEKTIKKVINDFKRFLICPSKNISKNNKYSYSIYVYDNNSSDKTAEIAKKAGAIVIKEFNQGKGNVVRSMFRDVDADIYLMIDGDDTYPVNEAYKLIEAIAEGYDMAIGDRLSSTYYVENKRMFHNFGNDLVRFLINIIFKSDIKDVMTGYRAFSKKFVKTMPIMSTGFQIETELTVNCLEYRYNVKSLPIQYRDRPEGSQSKLNTISDGIKVLITIFDMFKNYKPFFFFTVVSMLIFIVGLMAKLSVPYMMLLSIILIGIGLILDYQANIDKKNHELYINEWANLNEKHN